MEVFLPKDIQAGLDEARRANMRKASRVRIDLNGRLIKVLRMWKTGFAVAQEDAPNLRGLIDLYDGPDLMFKCLIISKEEQDGELHYRFKRATPAMDHAGPEGDATSDAPVGLVGASKF